MSKVDTVNRIFVDNWSSVFGTILGAEVKVSFDKVEEIPRASMGEQLSTVNVYVTLKYGDGADEVIGIGLGSKLVSIISNLMIGLDSFKDEINDDDKDAFSEAVNQMFSACQVPFKEELGVTVNFADISFTEQSELIGSFKDNSLRFWEATFDIENISKEKMLLYAPSEFVNEPQAAAAAAPVAEAPAATPVASAAPVSEKSIEVNSNITMLLDVEMPVTVRIGSSQMKLVEIMRLGLGSLVELDKLVDDPVDVLVNDKVVARGEIVVYDGNFAVRILEVESKTERIKSLG